MIALVCVSLPEGINVFSPKPSKKPARKNPGKRSNQTSWMCTRFLAHPRYIKSMKFKRLSGWWFQPTPLKNMKVSWDDYSKYMEK